MKLGQILKDRYKIVKLISKSRFAHTYLADDILRKKKCIVKSLSLSHSENWKVLELFEREAKVLSNVKHPGIPKFIDFFSEEKVDDKTNFTVQEYINGEDLHELIKKGRHFSQEEVVKIGLKVSAILKYLHSLSPPIIHRDIKPGNIILTPEFNVFLIDFGAVRDRILLSEDRNSTMVGTFGYMPPEQFHGDVSSASDIFSLTATMIFLLSHKDPSTMETERLRINFKKYVNVSKSFESILTKALKPVRENRTQTADEFHKALSNINSNKFKLKPLVIALTALFIISLLSLLFIFNNDSETSKIPSIISYKNRKKTSVNKVKNKIKKMICPVKIVFASERDGNLEIYTILSDSSNLQRLTNNSSDDHWPTWSPDKQKICFSNNSSGKYEVYTMNADGTNPLRLTSNNVDDAVGDWSGDGNKILITSWRDGNSEIYVMDSDGSNPKRLTNNVVEDSDPAWSPDGSKIVFMTKRNGNWEIYTMASDGTDLNRLTSNDQTGSPSWSPDGTKISFQSDRDGNYEIYVMDTDGSNQTRITNNISIDQQSWWSSDGSKIVWQTNRDGNRNIYTMDSKGGNQKQVTSNTSQDWTPVW